MSMRWKSLWKPTLVSRKLASASWSCLNRVVKPPLSLAWLPPRFLNSSLTWYLPSGIFTLGAFFLPQDAELLLRLLSTLTPRHWPMIQATLVFLMYPPQVFTYQPFQTIRRNSHKISIINPSIYQLVTQQFGIFDGSSPGVAALRRCQSWSAAGLAGSARAAWLSSLGLDGAFADWWAKIGHDIVFVAKNMGRSRPWSFLNGWSVRPN